MSYLYFGAMAEDNATTIVKGSYIRMGTYVDDATVAEYAEMPSAYTTQSGVSDSTGSEGVFLTTCGQFILTSTSKGYFEYGTGATQNVTGNYTMTVSDGNFDQTVNGGNITYESENGLKFRSSEGDITIEAASAKVSVRSRRQYSRTAGYYMKWIWGNKVSIFNGVTTNVSLSILIAGYGAPTVSGNVSLMLAITTASLSLVGVKVSGVGFALKLYATQSMKLTLDDTGIAVFYIKYRGYQLESGVKYDKAGLSRTIFGTVMLHQLVGAHLNKSSIKATIGFGSTIPGG